MVWSGSLVWFGLECFFLGLFVLSSRLPCCGRCCCCYCCCCCCWVCCHCCCCVWVEPVSQLSNVVVEEKVKRQQHHVKRHQLDYLWPREESPQQQQQQPQQQEQQEQQPKQIQLSEQRFCKYDTNLCNEGTPSFNRFNTWLLNRLNL